MRSLASSFVCGALATIAAVACTPGAATAPSNGSASASGAVVVAVSLIKYGQATSSFGAVGGYSPAVIVVARGTPVQFRNDDTFAHTASGLGSAAFPQTNPLGTAAQSLHGSDVSQPDWSTGNLGAGALSAPLNTSQPGTYFFGCFYHYPTMRGVIVVR
ncbi:MAG: hypothetical protein DLM53_09215 [Candidatus Eremiobacter antarcticus]|nr:hypothetical protein [Candidatus Eremiobacteraeota bacterium]PZR61399.1 MAG: hypothetical protein DLM53_09215 [Candidatus Eremiobacter sp. RRmetagenome_bin22]